MDRSSAPVAVDDADASGPGRARYRWFGGFRFLLALAVVVSHSWSLRVDRQDELVARIGIGSVAVMGFFVLSGFIISEASETFYRGRPAAFLVNRLLRIVPPYLAALMLSGVVHAVLIGRTEVIDQNGVEATSKAFAASNLLYNVLAISPINPGDPTYQLVAFQWAIRAEVLFYVAVAAVMVLSARLRPEQRGPFLVAATVAVLAVHVASEYGPLPTWLLDLSFVPYFVLGMAIQRLSRLSAGIAPRLAAAASVVLLVVHFTRYTQGKVAFADAWGDAFRSADVLLPVALTAAMPVILVALLGIERERWREGDRVAGQLTYPLYVNHALVIVLVMTFIGPGTSVWPQVLVWVASIALAAVMNEIVERPLRRVRDRVRGTRL